MKYLYYLCLKIGLPMKDFSIIANGVLSGTYQGTFKLRNGEYVHSDDLVPNKCPILGYDYPYVLGKEDRTYSRSGRYFYGRETPFDVVDFVKDKQY